MTGSRTQGRVLGGRGDDFEFPQSGARDEVGDVCEVEVRMAGVDGVGASVGAVAFVTEGDGGGGCPVHMPEP